MRRKKFEFFVTDLPEIVSIGIGGGARAIERFWSETMEAAVLELDEFFAKIDLPVL